MGNFPLSEWEFCLREWAKLRRFNFRLTNVSSSNINTTNLKLFQSPRQDSGIHGRTKCWMPWRMTQSQISRKTSRVNYDFRKGGGPCPPAPPSPLFVEGLFLHNHGCWDINTCLRKNWRKILERCRNVRECILEINFEGLWWS